MFILFSLFLSLSIPVFAMEKSRGIPHEIPKKNIPWLKKCIYEAFDHWGQQTNVSLKQLCFMRLIKNLLEKDCSLQTLDHLPWPKEMAEIHQKWLNLIFATEWFRLCGKLYEPSSVKLSHPFTKMSPDKSFFFQYNDHETIMYHMDDITPSDPYTIKGKLLGISLDSLYLLLDRDGRMIVFDSKEQIDVCSYEGPFKMNEDFLIFNPHTKNCFISRFIQYVRCDYPARHSYYYFDEASLIKSRPIPLEEVSAQ